MEELSQIKSLVNLISSEWIILSDSNENRKKQYDDILSKLTNEQSNHNACKNALQQANEEIEKLKLKISTMEQNYNEFAKVSHVVSLEKENAKLKSELKRLKESRSKIDISTQVEDIDKDRIVVQEQQEPDSHSEVEHDEEYYEKKIKGVIYYVGIASQKIYKKNDDGEVGSQVGVIHKETKVINNSTKTVSKVVWL